MQGLRDNAEAKGAVSKRPEMDTACAKGQGQSQPQTKERERNK